MVEIFDNAVAAHRAKDLLVDAAPGLMFVRERGEAGLRRDGRGFAQALQQLRDEQARLGRIGAVALHPGRDAVREGEIARHGRSEEHTSELQSLMRISYAVSCLKKKTTHANQIRSDIIIQTKP